MRTLMTPTMMTCVICMTVMIDMTSTINMPQGVSLIDAVNT